MEKKIPLRKLIDKKLLQKALSSPSFAAVFPLQTLGIGDGKSWVHLFGEEGVLINPAEFSIPIDDRKLVVHYAPSLEREQNQCLKTFLGILLEQSSQKCRLGQETLQKYKEINSVFALSQNLGKSRFISDVATQILNEFKTALPCALSSIWIYQGQKKQLIQVATNHGSRPLFDPWDEEKLMLHLIETHRIADIFSQPHPKFFPDSLSVLDSCLFIPLKAGDNFSLGGILLANPPKREFLSGELKLGVSLGIQAGFSLQNSLLFEEIESLFDGVVRGLIAAIDERDSTTSGHSARIARICERFALCVNASKDGKFADFEFSSKELREIKYAGLLHDIGKIGVREDVLKKKSKLSQGEVQGILSRFDFIALKDQISLETERECILRSNEAYNLSEDDFRTLSVLSSRTFVDPRGQTQSVLSEHEFENLSIRHGNLTESEIQEMRKHPAGTYKILSKIRFSKDLENIAKIGAQHHEKLDGSGYPHGLKSGEILIQAQIMCIADIYEALVDTKRPYKPGLSRFEALAIIDKEVQEEKIDRDLFRIFQENLDDIVGPKR